MKQMGIALTVLLSLLACEGSLAQEIDGKEVLQHLRQADQAMLGTVAIEARIVHPFDQNALFRSEDSEKKVETVRVTHADRSWAMDAHTDPNTPLPQYHEPYNRFGQDIGSGNLYVTRSIRSRSLCEGDFNGAYGDEIVYRVTNLGVASTETAQPNIGKGLPDPIGNSIRLVVLSSGRGYSWYLTEITQVVTAQTPHGPMLRCQAKELVQQNVALPCELLIDPNKNYLVRSARLNSFRYQSSELMETAVGTFAKSAKFDLNVADTKFTEIEFTSFQPNANQTLIEENRKLFNSLPAGTRVHETMQGGSGLRIIGHDGEMLDRFPTSAPGNKSR